MSKLLQLGAVVIVAVTLFVTVEMKSGRAGAAAGDYVVGGDDAEGPLLDRVDLAFKDATREVADPWGTPLQVKDEGQLRVATSAGPDKQFGTGDDRPFVQSLTR